MANSDSTEKNLPPYIPFSTFLNFVERLKTTAVPSTIDNTVMPNLAGGVRGQVRSALRFLGLTDSDDHVSTTFRDLIQAHGSENWGAALGAVIESAYQPVLNGLDHTGATPGQLQAKFKAAGVMGQMAEKSIRFLLAALESAGMPFSLHLSNRGAISLRKGARRTTKTRADSPRSREPAEEETTEHIPQPVSGMKVRSFSFPVPGEPDIRVVVPEKLDDPDVWEMVDATLRSYIRLNAKARDTAAERERGGQ